MCFEFMKIFVYFFCVLLFICQVLSDSLWPHGLQNSRLPCPFPSPRVCPSSCQLYWWCHQTISPFVVPFSCPQSSPASRSFPVSQLFTSRGQSIRASASALVLPMNIQDWFLLGLTGLIFLLSKRFSRLFSNTTVESISSLVLNLLYGPALTTICDYWKDHSLDCTNLCWQSDVLNTVFSFL